MKKIYKKIVAMFLVVVLTFSLTICSYQKAYATAVVIPVVVGEEVILSLFISVLALAGIYDVFDDTDAQEYGVSDYSELSETQRIDYTDNVRRDYNDFILEYKDIYTNGAVRNLVGAYCGEYDIDKALERYTKTMVDIEVAQELQDDKYNGLSEEELQETQRQLVVVYTQKYQYGKYGDGKKPDDEVGSILADLGVTGSWLNKLAELMKEDIVNYVKNSDSDYPKFNKDNYYQAVNQKSNIVFDESSDIYKCINDRHINDDAYAVISAEEGTCISVPFADSPSRSCQYVVFYPKSNTSAIAVDYDLEDYWSYFLPLSCNMNFYDEYGSLIFSGGYGRNSYSWFHGTLVYWSYTKFSDSFKDHIGATGHDFPYHYLYGDKVDDEKKTVFEIGNINVDTENSASVNKDNGYLFTNKPENVIDSINSSVEPLPDKESIPSLIPDVLEDITNQIKPDLSPSDQVDFDTNIRPNTDPSTGPILDPNLNDWFVNGLNDKFPFCIPFDLINLVSVLDAEPKTPYWEFPFVFDKVGVDEKIIIDLSKFDTVAEICRWIETFAFCGFLIIKTRGLIRG